MILPIFFMYQGRLYQIGKMGKAYRDVEMLVKISDYFGISVDQLIKKETIPSVAKNSDKQKNRSILFV